jgi:multiple sugar transport system substrate-binding protein/putative aldouronate transport system substrate-binding protein
MTLRKTLAAILTLCLLLPIVAACGNGGGTGGSGSEDRGEPIDLVVYSQLANYSGEMVGWSAEVLLEKFNVRMTIINDAIDGTFQTRMELGFLGDLVIFGNDGREYREASAAGLLFDWLEDDLLWDYGEYIADSFMPALNKNRGITGTLHGFGHEIAGTSGDHAAFYYYPHLRFDLYKQLGFPEINTLEDFIPVLADMVALEPTTPVGTKTYAVSSFPDWDGDMVMMVKSTAALYGWEEFHMGLYCTQTTDWQGALHEDGWYLRCLKFYNSLHQLGLYDPDSMTQDWNNLVEKYKNGAAMFNIFEWIAGYFNTDEHKDMGKMMMPVAANDQINLADGLSIYGKNRVWAIGANSNHPELCMEIINWLCTPEGVLTYNYGPKGVTWDIDENGDPYMTELGLATQDDSDTVITYRNYTGTYKAGEFQHNNITWARDAVNPDSPSGFTFNYTFWPSTQLARIVPQVEQDWRDWSGFNMADDYLKARPHTVAIASTYTASQRSRELETTWAQVQMAIREGSWNAIYASSDAEFYEIVANMIYDAVAYGYDQCVEWIWGEVELRREAEARAASG